MNLMELQILDWIQAHIAHPILDTIMPILTRFGDKGVFWILLTLTLLLIPKTRKLGAAMAFALIIESLFTDVVIKRLVARPRPFDVNPTIQLLISKPHDFSFPSGHTGASFAAASALCFCKNKYGKLAVVLAVLIALSRLYLYVHYPTDVLFGACWGVCAGFLGTLLMKKVMRNS